MKRIHNYLKLPYRKNISCIVFKDNKYLLVQLLNWKINWWKFPQGGIDKKETEKEAIKRELFEELNIKDFKIVGKSKAVNIYDWPEKIIKINNFKYRGQHQHFYIVEYKGSDSDIKIKDKKELRKFIWVTKDELFKLFDIKAKEFSGYKKAVKKIFKEYAKIFS